MLGKLIKHEFVATGRNFSVLFIVLLLTTVASKLFIELDIDNPVLTIFKGLFIAAYVLSIMAVLILSFVFIVIRFYKNTLGDEGYLTFTLPVNMHQHIISKLITYSIWTIVSVLAVIGSVLVMFIGSGVYDDIFSAWNAFMDAYGSESVIWILAAEFLVLTIVGIFSGILMYFACISIGQLVNRHKILASIGAYFGITFILQFVSFFVMFALGLSDTSVEIGDSFNYVTSFYQKYLIVSILLQLGLGIIYYVITHYLLSKKLNLE